MGQIPKTEQQGERVLWGPTEKLRETFETHGRTVDYSGVRVLGHSAFSDKRLPMTAYCC